MAKIFGNMDTLTRLIGGFSLAIAGLINLFQPNLRSLQTLMLWISLFVSVIALVFALKEGCSWYAGFFILLSSIFLFSFRYSGQATSIVFSLVALIVGVAAFYVPIAKKCTRLRLVIKK